MGLGIAPDQPTASGSTGTTAVSDEAARLGSPTPQGGEILQLDTNVAWMLTGTDPTNPDHAAAMLESTFAGELASSTSGRGKSIGGLINESTL